MPIVTATGKITELNIIKEIIFEADCLVFQLDTNPPLSFILELNNNDFITICMAKLIEEAFFHKQKITIQGVAENGESITNVGSITVNSQ
ncbi:hypothetical protein [Bacillus cereus]